MSAKKTDDLNTKKTAKIRSSKHKNSKKKPTPASWKPGQTGNPRGRPPVRNSLAETFRDYLDGRDKSGRIRKNLLADRLFALTGDSVGAIRLFCDVVSNFELEERLIRLEEQMENLIGRNQHGSN